MVETLQNVRPPSFFPRKNIPNAWQTISDSKADWNTEDVATDAV